jgi:Flp pilus assembly protein TadD
MRYHFSAMNLNDELVGVNHHLTRGRPHRARALLLPVLDRHPDDPHLLALRARLDAETGRISLADSEAAVRALVENRPDDVRLRTSAALLAAQDGRRAAGLEELRQLAGSSTDAYVHQTLAGLLHGDRGTWAEAWTHYATALRAGPLSTPCYRSAAYRVGRSVDPPGSAVALQGAAPVERLAIRTRALGPVTMFALVDAVALAGVGLRVAGASLVALLLMGMATAIIGWFVYANALACCRTCRNAWLAQAALLWLLFLLVSPMRGATP